MFERVTVSHVTKVYGRQRALHDVSFELEAGRICALLGPNGSGKSTLLGILSTFLRPSSGEIQYGQVSYRDASAELRGQVGWVAHDSFVYGDLTGRENLLFFARLCGAEERVADLVDTVGLKDAADRPARTYSRGMTQRLALARALVGDARLLLLDEPFTGLDRSGVADLRDLLVRLRAEKRIILLATHDLPAVSNLAEQVIVLRRGKMVHHQAQPHPIEKLEEILSTSG